jgi:hypothetical protein
MLRKGATGFSDVGEARHRPESGLADFKAFD